MENRCITSHYILQEKVAETKAITCYFFLVLFFFGVALACFFLVLHFFGVAPATGADRSDEQEKEQTGTKEGYVHNTRN